MWIIFLQALNESKTEVLPSSGVRASIRDRIKIIYFKAGYSKSLNLDLSALSYIMSLKLFFSGFCIRALSFQFLYSFCMSKCGDSPLEVGHMPNNAPGTEHPWKAGNDVSW